MDYGKYVFDGSRKYTLNSVKPGDASGIKDKKEAKKILEANKLKIEQLQDKLYADGCSALLVVLQAMDAAGKDGTVKHVFGGVNPEGIQVTSFKQPSTAEVSRDYLWRVHNAVPPRGSIGVFNRSHYEDVLVCKILNLPRQQNYTKRVYKNMWERRYGKIRSFEQHLYDNGTTIVKIHLRLSKDEQRRRFMERLDDPGKNWKFSKSDLSTREMWDDYEKAYRDCINRTATPCAPWYVVPADKKWYTRAVVSEIVVDALRSMKPAYPKMDEAHLKELEECRAQLENEAVPAQT